MTHPRVALNSFIKPVVHGNAYRTPPYTRFPPPQKFENSLIGVDDLHHKQQAPPKFSSFCFNTRPRPRPRPSQYHPRLAFLWRFLDVSFVWWLLSFWLRLRRACATSATESLCFCFSLFYLFLFVLKGGFDQQGARILVLRQLHQGAFLRCAGGAKIKTRGLTSYQTKQQVVAWHGLPGGL